MRKVVILQHRLLHYRVALFDQLRERLRSHGAELHLVHGQATRREEPKRDTGSLGWAHVVKNHYWEVGDRDLLWQHFPKELSDADLIVLMQENRLLSNYPILLRRRRGGPKIAFWGHGANFQSTSPNGLRERWKRLLVNRVDWWFAYTDLTTEIVTSQGFPANRVTTLNNAIDSKQFQESLDTVTMLELKATREKLGIPAGAPVGLFCGSLYHDKRLDFLIASADNIRSKNPQFNLVIIGDGPAMPFMREAAATRGWLHLQGVRKGREKALFFRMADVVLNPGLVGLHVVDAFCAGLTMITTSTARHSPEIAYLHNGINGFITSDSAKEYADCVQALFENNELRAQMRNSALADAKKYTLENMVSRFADGIGNCLSMERKA